MIHPTYFRQQLQELRLIKFLRTCVLSTEYRGVKQLTHGKIIMLWVTGFGLMILRWFWAWSDSDLSLLILDQKKTGFIIISIVVIFFISITIIITIIVFTEFVFKARDCLKYRCLEMSSQWYIHIFTFL